MITTPNTMKEKKPEKNGHKKRISQIALRNPL